MARFHKSNLGAFGNDLPVDLDGYTYTTAAEWLNDARLDGISSQQLADDEDWADEWAAEQAEAAQKAVDAANEAAAEWQADNS